jgi:pilus assembly protein CpaB
MKQKFILIASVVVGLLAALITRSYLNAKDREVRDKINQFNLNNRKVDVMVVKRAVPSGTVLRVEDLGAVAEIERAVRSHAVSAADSLKLIGRKTIRPLAANAIIHWSDIEGGQPGSGGLAEDIKQNMRAISINVSGAASVSGMVKPNDHVDVLGTFSFPSKEVEGELELVTMTILQDVLVLATGQETAKSTITALRRTQTSYNMVTLEVTPREAEMLVFAEQIKGRLALALRNPDDVYYEKELPRVDFRKIQAEIETLNEFRQKQLLRKRVN